MARASKYAPEFRQRSVHIARESERPIAAAARDLGIHHETLRVWVRQDEADAGWRTLKLRRSPRCRVLGLVEYSGFAYAVNRRHLIADWTQRQREMALDDEKRRILPHPCDVTRRSATG